MSIVNTTTHTAQNRTRRLAVSLAAGAVLLAACGGSDSAEPAETAAPVEEAAAAAGAISIEGFAFSSLEPVAPGTVIEVSNLDSAPHTLTATNGEFDTGNIDQNQTVTITAPSAPGTYEFFCAIHPSMTGQLVVS